MEVALQYVIILFSSQFFTDAGSMVTEPGFHWPMGVVNYYIDNTVYDHFIARKIRIAMNTVESASCVRFKPNLLKAVDSGNHSWINITNPSGQRDCMHGPEIKSDGEIVLVLGWDCMKPHEILHTLLHGIGFRDEVSHPQRDQYIRIMWSNIHPAFRSLYQTRSGDQHPQVEYDPMSVMQFHDRAFSMNGRATVIPLVPGLLINPSKQLSQLDKMGLRVYFNHQCNERKVVDMIDTCKMIVSGNDKPHKNAENTTDSKSNEKETVEEQGNISVEKQSIEGQDNNKEEKQSMDEQDNNNDENQSLEKQDNNNEEEQSLERNNVD